MGATISPTPELELYLQEPTLAIDAPLFDILKWWCINELPYPTLSSLAKMILMRPMTLISSESAFSTGGRMLGDYQNRLKPNMVEALVCGKNWICAQEGVGDENESFDGIF